MAITINNDENTSIGTERFKKDVRAFGGLLLLLGAAATFNPLANIAAGITPGSLPTEGIPLWGLIAGIVQTIIGTLAMLVGYLALVHDYGNRILTGSLIAITQLAWIPFLVDLSAIGMGTVSDPSMNPFIPQIYNPTSAGVKFVGSMGILSVLTYGTGFLGSVSFMEFSLMAYQSGKPGDRSAGYYRSRMTLYMFLLALAGLTQLLLGIYVISDIGMGPLQAPVGVAVYVVHFPELAIFVGLTQLSMGIWGMARRFGLWVGGADDHSYQIGMALTWVCVLSMMVMTQVSWAPEGMLAPAAPTIATLVLGLHVLPAFLDFKARTTPKVLPHNYYSDAIKKSAGLQEQSDEETAEQV